MKIDTLETVPPHVAIAAGLGGKAILLTNGEFRPETCAVAAVVGYQEENGLRAGTVIDGDALRKIEGN